MRISRVESLSRRPERHEGLGELQLLLQGFWADGTVARTPLSVFAVLRAHRGPPVFVRDKSQMLVQQQLPPPIPARPPGDGTQLEQCLAMRAQQLIAKAQQHCPSVV